MLNQLLPLFIGKGLHLSSIIFPNWASQTAIDLFCTPRKGRIKPKEKAFLDTCVQSDSFKTDKGTIQYYIWNESGPKTVLLMHGWESNSARWRFLIKKLIEDNFRVVAIDAPAHGRSSEKKFDMLKYIVAIDHAVNKFNPNILIGHSVGGASICFYLSEYAYPAFDKIVLLGTPTELTQMTGNLYRILGFSKRMIRLFRSKFEQNFGLEIAYISASRMVNNLDIPTLIVHDKHDEVIDVKDAEAYHQLLPNSKLVITEKYGHGLQNRVVFKAIMDFLISPS